MKILVIGDNHNDIENMLNFLDKIQKNEFDVIVYTGDFTDVNTPRGFTQEDIAKLLIEELKTLNKPIVAVPGNNDTKGVVSLIEKEGISVHGKGKIIDGVGFYGYGGAKTPFNTTIEPTDDEIKKGLNNAWLDVDKTKVKVQITHMPALNTRLDMVSFGTHVGSRAIRGFIEEKKPVVAVSAHIHEAKGIDRIGSTLIINSGRFSE
jgi:hypothetical protein